MLLSSFVTKTNIVIPTQLVELSAIDFSVIDYTKVDGAASLTHTIDEEGSWDMGCVVSPGSNDGYFVTVSIFQGNRHFPVLAVRVHGDCSDAIKVFEICTKYIETTTIH